MAGIGGLLGGCSSVFEGLRASGPHFAKFTEPSKKLTVKTDLKNIDRRMPGVQVSAAHWVVQRKGSGRLDLPAPEDRYWLHAVIELKSDSTQRLVGASNGTADPLPGIYPDLRQYVPKKDVFTTVPKAKADEILDVEHLVQDSDEGSGSETFGVDELAVCSSSNLMILIGSGVKP